MKLLVSYTTDPTGMAYDKEIKISLPEGTILFCYSDVTLFQRIIYNKVRELLNEPEYLHIWKVHYGKKKTSKQGNIIGYQIESKDGKHRIPEEFNSFEVLTEAVANFWMANYDDGTWKLVEIFEGDVEEPTFVEYL